MAEEKTIKCPNCHTAIQVEEVFFKQAEDRVRKELAEKSKKQAEELNQLRAVLEKDKEEFEKKKQKENELFREKLKQELEKESKKLAEDTEKKFGDRYKSLEEDFLKKQRELNELKAKELEFLRKEKEMSSRLEEVRLEMEKKFLERSDEISKAAGQKEKEKADLEIAQLKKMLEDQKKLTEEMQRKANQGSMQMQGEILELVLEEELKAEFPFDIIEEVPKGVKGADLIQTVVNGRQQSCGKIIYEGKRTKAFSESWIEKLKEDQRVSGASLAVIVTETMPKEMSRFGRKDGVWICTYREFRSLSAVLREILIREYEARASMEDKGDKMSMLYSYLTGNEFRQRVEAIVEGFSAMKEDIEKEKRAMMKLWKEREKQIEKVITNTIDMYGSVKGIAGNSIGDVKSLELPGGDESD
jgi:hypothetical protein